MVIDGDYIVEWFVFASSVAMACRREELFFFIYFVKNLFSSSSSSSKVVTRVIHYMTPSSKTHRNAQPRC